jgi:hypothetical protein
MLWSLIDITDGSLVYKRCCPGKSFPVPYSTYPTELGLAQQHRDLTQMISLILICLWVGCLLAFETAFYLRTFEKN